MSFWWSMLGGRVGDDPGSITNDDSLAAKPYLHSPRLNNPDSISFVLEAKDRGNALFKVTQYANALSEYNAAISYFAPETISTPSRSSSLLRSHSNSSNTLGKSANSLPEARSQDAEDVETAHITLLTSLLSNRAACYLHLFEYGKALYDAYGVIKYRPDWIKGYYRKGEALLGLRRFTAAIEAFTKALEFESSDEFIEKRLKLARIHVDHEETGLLVHQLFPSREICKKTMFAPLQSMIYHYALDLRNFIYLIGNKSSKECFVIDICWDVDGVISYAEKLGFTIAGAIITHYHVDHVGGIPPPPFDKYGIRIDGIAKFIKRKPGLPVYAHELEIDAIIKANPELSHSHFTPTHNGKMIFLPTSTASPTSKPFIPLKKSSRPAPSADSNNDEDMVTMIEFIHTPGHTPGSQCVLINGSRLFSGDTLFIHNCGRLDFPDSDKASMYESLQGKLASLNDTIVVFPGHDYGGEYTTIAAEKANGMLRPLSRDTFLARF